MANVFTVNVYQIDQYVYPRDQSVRIAFPSTGNVLGSCIDSPTRSLSSGYQVYGVIFNAGMGPVSAQANAMGSKYYVQETIAQLITLAG